MASTNTNNKTPSYTNHNGFLMPAGFPTENFSSATSWKPQLDDLVIATYPKSGTTLTQHMTYIMLNDGIPVQPGEKLDVLFPHLEEVGNPSSASVKSGKRLIKTHLPYDKLSKVSPESIAKFIFVARNPKDCIVSFFHHTRGFPQHYDFEDGEFGVYHDLFCKGEVDFGSYFDMLRSWLDHKDDENVLFITYEDIRANKKKVISEIAEFIGGGTKEKLMEDDGILMDKILKYSSLEEMKKDPLRWCSERKAEHSPFVRSGKVGGWGELLTKEQGDKLDEIMREKFTPEELNYLGEKY